MGDGVTAGLRKTLSMSSRWRWADFRRVLGTVPGSTSRSGQCEQAVRHIQNPTGKPVCRAPTYHWPQTQRVCPCLEGKALLSRLTCRGSHLLHCSEPGNILSLGPSVSRQRCSSAGIITQGNPHARGEGDFVSSLTSGTLISEVGRLGAVNRPQCWTTKRTPNGNYLAHPARGVARIRGWVSVRHCPGRSLGQPHDNSVGNRK